MVNNVAAKARRLPVGMDDSAPLFAPDNDDFLSAKVDTHFIGDLDSKFPALTDSQISKTTEALRYTDAMTSFVKFRISDTKTVTPSVITGDRLLISKEIERVSTLGIVPRISLPSIPITKEKLYTSPFMGESSSDSPILCRASITSKPPPVLNISNVTSVDFASTSRITNVLSNASTYSSMDASIKSAIGMPPPPLRTSLMIIWTFSEYWKRFGFLWSDYF